MFESVMKVPISDPRFSESIREQSTLPDKEISEKIRSLTAIQIELLGLEIVQEIISYLGPIGNAIAADKILKIRGTENEPLNKKKDPLDNARRMFIMNANELIKKNNTQAFFNDEKRAIFTLSLLWPIKRELEKSFSLPEKFMENGLFISLSNYEPTEIISNIAKKTDIKISKFDIPIKYSIKFGSYFDNEKKELVFYVIHKSAKCEFSKVLFTLKDLETKHLGNLSIPKSKL